MNYTESQTRVICPAETCIFFDMHKGAMGYRMQCRDIHTRDVCVCIYCMVCLDCATLRVLSLQRDTYVSYRDRVLYNSACVTLPYYNCTAQTRTWDQRLLSVKDRAVYCEYLSDLIRRFSIYAAKLSLYVCEWCFRVIVITREGECVWDIPVWYDILKRSDRSQ